MNNTNHYFKPIVSLFLLLFFVGLITADAQNISINADGSAPDNSSMLDVSSTTMGLLAPRMSQVQRDAIVNPATGLLIYQIDVDSGFYYNIGIPATPNWLKMQSQNDGMTFISDQDGDTYIEVEQNTDEDLIRFNTKGVEFFRIDSARFEILNTNNNIFIGENSGQNFDYLNNSAEPNVALGAFALESITSGTKNVAIGARSLRFNTTGTDNTAVGIGTAENNTVGSRNTAIGAYSLSANQNGFDNTAVGRYSLFRIDGGNSNTAIGQFSGAFLASGDANVIFGNRTMRNNITGSDNTALGASAGENNLGSSNVFLGFRAGFNELGSNKLYIENSLTNNPLIYGDFANDSVVINGSFSVNRNYTFPNIAPINNGDVLQYDGTNLIWGTSGSQTLSSVLSAGKDAGADSIFNLNAMTIGSTRAPQTSLEIDSFFVVQGKPFNGFRWSGFNAYYDGVSTTPLYLNDGTADLFVSGPDKLLLGHWNTSTTNSLLANNAATSIEMDSTSISLMGEDVNFEIYLRGNVGVGTTSPSTKLTVTEDAAAAIMNLQSAGSNTLMDFNNLGINPADWTFGYLGNTGVNPGFMTFLRGGIHRMAITNNGDVGIGTTTPAYLLDVNGSARVNNLRVNTANLQFGASMEVANRSNIIGAGTPNLFIGNNASDYVQLIYNSAGYGQLFTAGVNDIVLSAGGNVGIGVTNPSSELEVIGDIEIPAANDFTYSTAKTHYQSFAPTTFNSLLPDVFDFGTFLAASFYAYFRNGGTAFGYATVEVNLPDGAVVTELEAWIYDNLATNPVRVSLYRQALGSPTVGVMAEIESATATASTAVQNLTDNTITFGTQIIDNQNYAYFLMFTGRQNNTESRLYGTKITYTVTEAD